MSDYLFNLANRALGLATVVRPRITPWFGIPDQNRSIPAELTTRSEVPAEQSGIPDVSIRVDAAETENVLGAPQEERVRSRSIVAAKEPEAAEHRGPDEPEELTIAEEVRITKGQREKQPEANWRPVKGVSKAQPVESPVQASDSNGISGLTVASASSAEPDLKGKRNSQIQPATKPAMRTDQSPSTEASRDPLQQNGMAQTETTQRGSGPALRTIASVQPAEKRILLDLQAFQPAQTTSRAVSVQATRASARNRTQQFPGPAQNDPEPTIQVTIGRVEVRANLPITAPRQTPPAPASTSLDDYLKSRARGAIE